MEMKKRRLWALSFLFLFSIYWCGIVYFTHSHLVNGVIIVHSHPGTVAGHSHSDAEYETIFYLSHFYSLQSEGFVFEPLQRFALCALPFVICEQAVLLLPHFAGRLWRAPPQLCF